jgi:RNA recognition motif-containing protein
MYRQEGFEMIPLPDQDVTRIKLNLEEGKPASFQGEFKLYVGNISFECSEDDLYQVFNEVGPVGDVSMVRDETGRSRGFAFVTMRNKDDGEKSISILDGKEVQGRGIAVRASNN